MRILFTAVIAAISIHTTHAMAESRCEQLFLGSPAITTLQQLAAFNKEAGDNKITSTVSANSHIEVVGTLSNVIVDINGNIAYVQTAGSTKLMSGGEVIEGQDLRNHPSGFGTPIGKLADGASLSTMNEAELAEHGLTPGQQTKLIFASGVVVDGTVDFLQKSSDNRLLVIRWNNCKVTSPEGKTLFSPKWGWFDMIPGEFIQGLH